MSEGGEGGKDGERVAYAVEDKSQRENERQRGGASPSVSPLHTWLSCHSCSSLPVTPFLSSPHSGLTVAAHNDGPVLPPVCQPFTCILATTSPLAPVLHAEQANKMPGE
ncbi:unnamed protein product [Pleuronectes platessa]|uniref:Uncharacterized protein n=1 Tax=Pleuronectes platessa TaxID=8262 RepID=A0A9N7YW97_PLEPL|nr:unnamed protein product [Pleuronectes platessa]